MANARERSESIYTALPVLGPIPSLYDPGTTATATRRSDAAATSSLDILNRVHQLGPVDHVLTRTLSERRELESARRRNRERLDRVRRDDDGELDAEGDADYTDSVVNTRKRGWSSATAAEGGDDEKTELSSSRAGTRRTRSSRQRKKPNPLDPSSASDSLFGPRLSLSTPSIDLPCSELSSRLFFFCCCSRSNPRRSVLNLLSIRDRFSFYSKSTLSRVSCARARSEILTLVLILRPQPPAVVAVIGPPARLPSLDVTVPPRTSIDDRDAAVAARHPDQVQRDGDRAEPTRTRNLVATGIEAATGRRSETSPLVKDRHGRTQTRLGQPREEIRFVQFGRTRYGFFLFVCLLHGVLLLGGSHDLTDDVVDS